MAELSGMFARLLDRAARAAGYVIKNDEIPEDWQDAQVDTRDGLGMFPWNPLDSDEDAFRLMVDLDIAVRRFKEHSTVIAYGPKTDAHPEGFDALQHCEPGGHYMAARVAIVAVAAAMHQEGTND